MVGIDFGFLVAVSGPPRHGYGAKRMRGHGGKSAAPRENMLCGLKALLVAVLDVRLRLGFSPTTSLSPKWRAYIAAFPARQAQWSAFCL
jgi:hypothetical protein